MKAWWLAAFLVAGACGDLVPDVGPPTQERCLDEDTDLDVDVSLAADITPRIFMPDDIGCWYCHRPDAEMPLGFQLGGLDLSTYQGLRAGGYHSGTAVIVPGKPCQSILFQKVGEGPPFGGRMPLSGPPFLDDEQLGLIHDWIAEGAQDD